MSDRFISPAAPPTAREREISEIMIEECAEVQQRLTKLLRFGPQERQPGQHDTNAMRASGEVGDLLEIIDVAIREGLLLPDFIALGREHKRKQLAKFMQTEAPNV